MSEILLTFLIKTSISFVKASIEPARSSPLKPSQLNEKLLGKKVLDDLESGEIPSYLAESIAEQYCSWKL